MKILKHDVLINFKKLLNRLHKKEEENLLNRKKKREEAKQKQKAEKRMQKNQNNLNAYYQNLLYQINGLQNINPQLGIIDYQNFMPYGLPNPMFYNQILYYNCEEVPKEPMDVILQNMQQRGIINNIIGALFIKEDQERPKAEDKNVQENAKENSEIPEGKEVKNDEEKAMEQDPKKEEENAVKNKEENVRKEKEEVKESQNTTENKEETEEKMEEKNENLESGESNVKHCLNKEHLNQNLDQNPMDFPLGEYKISVQ